MKKTFSAATALLLAASPIFAQTPASALTKIGTAAAVRGAVKAVSAGAAVGHVISSGKPLFTNDHVTTDAAGRLQVLLIDETVFTLGPNSDMVLDDFVYDPKTSAGKITANIAKGTFRFVTGKIAQKDPSRLKIKTAVGTIGVRGSIGVGETGPNGTTIINGGARNADNHDDAAGIYAQSNGKTVNLPQPGVGTHIGKDGSVEDAHFMTGDLNRIMGTLQTDVSKSSGKGGNGGSMGRRSATDASGRSTSVGGLLADLSADDLALNAGANSAMTLAAQQAANTTTISTWDQVRSITLGNGTYTGSGSWTCISGPCAGGGTFDFSVPVNFASRQFTGGSIVISGGFSETGTISVASYASATGQAIESPSVSGVAIGNNFSGTTLTFLNRGDQTAVGMAVKLNYTNTSTNPVITGSATGSR